MSAKKSTRRASEPDARVSKLLAQLKADPHLASTVAELVTEAFAFVEGGRRT